MTFSGGGGNRKPLGVFSRDVVVWLCDWSVLDGLEGGKTEGGESKNLEAPAQRQ